MDSSRLQSLSGGSWSLLRMNSQVAPETDRPKLAMKELLIFYGLLGIPVIAATSYCIRLYLKHVARTKKRIGVAKYQVDATAFDPVALKVARSRVDASKRMKLAHEPGEWDKWLKHKVAASLAGIEDGSNRTIPDDEWAAERAQWEREARGV